MPAVPSPLAKKKAMTATDADDINAIEVMDDNSSLYGSVKVNKRHTI